MDVAVKEHADLQQVADHLASFADLFKQHPTLEHVLLNPAVPVPRKRAAMVELTARANVMPMVGKLLLLLAERDRLVLVPDIVAAYNDRLLDKQNVVRAEVTSAEPLPPDRAKAIEHELAKLTGRKVQLGTRVDPSIIGGVVTRIGDTIYDGSVSTQLQKIKKTLWT